ncbi:hypothetical protein ACFWWS_40070 [Streptomyces sp. NPDC059083]|uniref:hypothetical protein n=1 Tax=Streptomyces sp. NPDC059083 TaxID=3346721 RepID=UPI00369BEA32
MRIIAALPIAFAALLLAGCGSGADASNSAPTSAQQPQATTAPSASVVPPSTTATAVQTSAPAQPADDASAQRRDTCQEFLAYFQSAKDLAASVGSPWSADKAAEDSIGEASKAASWATMPAAQQQAIKAGIRDAATGSCS